MEGWVCPSCKSNVSPHVAICPCTHSKPSPIKSSKSEHDGYGFNSENYCVGCGSEGDHENGCIYQ